MKHRNYVPKAHLAIKKRDNFQITKYMTLDFLFIPKHSIFSKKFDVAEELWMYTLSAKLAWHGH